MEKLICASKSLYRQSVLKSLQIPFQAVAADIDESFFDTLAPEERPLKLAQKKVEQVLLLKDYKNYYILGADTLIVHNGKALGKPSDAENAKQYLKDLSGSTHHVISAICLYNPHTAKTTTRTCNTAVTFAELTDPEIDSYIASGEWAGAAGAYRIQGRGEMFIKKIEGSYSCVAGLPIFELYDILKKQKFFEQS